MNPLIKLIKMSVQKLKIFKKLKGSDGYSKNPILDSLIKQKLQSEMIIIKDNFNNLIQRQEARQRQPQLERPKMKRRLSTQNLATLTTERIKDSINFNHQRDREVLQFVINRQKASPFLEKAEIEGINTARTNYESITVKMNESDKVNYEVLGGMKDNKFDEEYQQNLNEKLRQIVPTDVWFPQQPEVQEIISNKAQQIQLSPLKLPHSLKFNLSHRPSSHSFEPLKSSRQKVPKKTSEEQGQITYDPNRYHKSDYSSLQRWLEDSIQSIHKRHQKHISSGQNIQPQLNYHLNAIYAVYISTIKEIIRLTYIQSAQKGLLMQKVIWSFIRLFEELVQQQHKLNFQDFKQSSKETKELRQLYEQRILKLQTLLSKRQQQIHAFTQTKKQIVMSCMTYRKVNIQMNDEIQTLMKDIKSLHHQNNYLMNNLTKLIQEFQKREVIKVQKQENFNMYYYLNQKNEIEVVARVPKEELLQKFFDSEMKQASIHNIQEEIAKEITKVDRLENDLTNFWLKKRNYLEIDRMIQENFVGGIEEVGIQVDVNGPNPYVDKQVQFPQENEETFEDFLKRQIVEERQGWSKKEVQLKEVTVTLKQLYDQARESITFLSNQNLTLKQTMDQKDHEISYLKRKIEQLDEKTVLYGKKIAIQQKEIENYKAEQVRMKEEIAKTEEKYNEERKRHLFEKENNNILVSTNYQLKSSLEKATKDFEELQQKIRILAPSLQQTMSLAQTSQNSTLTKLSTLIEAHLSKYVQKDAQVFLTH